MTPLRTLGRMISKPVSSQKALLVKATPNFAPAKVAQAHAHLIQRAAYKSQLSVNRFSGWPTFFSLSIGQLNAPPGLFEQAMVKTQRKRGWMTSKCELAQVQPAIAIAEVFRSRNERSDQGHDLDLLLVGTERAGLANADCAGVRIYRERSCHWPLFQNLALHLERSRKEVKTRSIVKTDLIVSYFGGSTVRSQHVAKITQFWTVTHVHYLIVRLFKCLSTNCMQVSCSVADDILEGNYSLSHYPRSAFKLKH